MPARRDLAWREGEDVYRSSVVVQVLHVREERFADPGGRRELFPS